MFGATNKPTGLATSFSAGTGLFGTSQPQQQQTGGLFGASTVSQPTFAFGQQQQKPAQQTFGGFGSGSTLLNTTTTQPQNTVFGGFGATNNLFNRPGTTAFGQTAATPSGSEGLFRTQNTSAFGGGLLTSNVVGTTIKFNPPAGTDSMMKNGISTNVSTKHHCLTAMKEYEGKSLEELRLEDYGANRKVGAVTTGGGLFGAAPAQNTGSLFGVASTSQPTTGFGLFGSTQPAATSGGLFGQMSTASTGLFGGTPQTSGSSLFGAQPKPATGGLFGAQPQTSQTGGLFGSTTGAFGTTGQTNTGGLFGGSTLGGQTTKSGFGFGLTNTTTTQSSIFNFGTTTTQAGGLFGANNQNKSIFGASTGGFGTTGTTGSVFNNPQTSTGGGLFGAKPTGFGVPNSTSGGLFGAPATQTGFGQTGSLFGGIGGTTQTSTGLGGGLLGSAGSTLNLGAQVPPTQLTTDPNTANAQHQMLQQQILALATSPYGDSPLFRSSLDSSKNDQRLQPVSSAAQKQHLSPSQHKVETKPRLSVKPNLHKTNRLFDGLDDDDDSLSFRQSFVPRNNPKALNIKTPVPASTVLPLSVSMNLSNSDFGKSDFSHLNPQDLAASFLLASQSENQSLANSSATSELKFFKRSSKAPDSGTQTDSVAAPESNSLTLSESLVDIPSETPKGQKGQQTKKTDSTSGSRLLRDSNDGSTTARSSLNAGNDETIERIMSPNCSMTPTSPDVMKKSVLSKESIPKLHHCTPVTSPNQGKENSMFSLDSVRSPSERKVGIKLYRPEYFTIPSKDELNKQLAETGKCVVQDFTVGRDGYGSVHFPGSTDITDIDLDEIVHIRRKEVTLYPNDETKPELGSGLNKRAVITLDKVWPIDKSNHLPITSPQKLSAMGYKDKIERSTAKLQAKFVEYRPETGSWVFEVKHFSKYKLFDDSDDEEGMDSRPSGDADAKGTCQTPMEHDTFIVQSSAKSKEPNSYALIPDSQTLKNRGLGGYEADSFEKEPSHLPSSNETRVTEYKTTLLEEFDHTEFLYEGEMTENFLRLCSKPSVTSKMDQMRATLFPEEKESSELFGDSWSLGKQFEMEAKTRSRHSQLPPSLRVDTIVKDSRKEYMTKFVEKQVFQPDFEGIDLNQGVFDVTDMSLLKQAKDHGFRMGSHAYRVSWKRNETAISCPIPQKSLKSLPISLFKKQSEAFKVIVSDVFDKKFIQLPEETSKILDIFLEFSSNDMHSDFPKYEMLENQELVANLIDVDTDLPNLKNVIKLCHSLFGLIDEDELVSSVGFGDKYEVSQRRRDYFGNWLTETCKQEMSAGCDIKNIPQEGNAMQRIMLLLTSNQKEEAVDLALRSNLPRLALLISQESSGELQRILTHVIQEWESLGISDSIDIETLKVYKLLAGDFNMLNHGSDEHTVCAGLGWKHCLGACLWFGTHQNSSIKSVVSKYTRMFEQGLCSAPMAVSTPLSGDTELESDNAAFSYYDCCYHIMNLVTDETHKPELALNPLTITEDIADYYPSWVLMNTLVTLGFCNLDPACKLNISTNFAWQLERAGLWPWAVFVLSFVPSELGRQSVIQELMDRNCTSSMELSKDELFVVNDLRLNKKVVHRSKALQAKIEKSFPTQLYHLLEAEEFVRGHQLLIDEKLAAHLYFSDKKEKDFLYEALETLSIHKHVIPCWDCKGAVIFEFLGLQKSSGHLSSQPISQNDLFESLFGIYNSFVLLLSKLVDFPLQTGVMKSLLEEISESVIVNIRMLNKMESGDILAPFMNELPLLRDQSLAQMRKLSTDIVSSLTEPNNDELEIGTSAFAAS